MSVLLVPPTESAGSNVIFLRVLFILALRSSVIFLTVTFFHSFSFLSLRKESVAWVGDESALLVLCCLTHPLRGWGYVNESKGSKVPDRPVVYATHRKLLRLPGECFVFLFCLLFPRAITGDNGTGIPIVDGTGMGMDGNGRE